MEVNTSPLAHVLLSSLHILLDNTERIYPISNSRVNKHAQRQKERRKHSPPRLATIFGLKPRGARKSESSNAGVRNGGMITGS